VPPCRLLLRCHNGILGVQGNGPGHAIDLRHETLVDTGPAILFGPASLLTLLPKLPLHHPSTPVSHDTWGTLRGDKKGSSIGRHASAAIAHAVPQGATSRLTQRSRGRELWPMTFGKEAIRIGLDNSEMVRREFPSVPREFRIRRVRALRLAEHGEAGCGAAGALECRPHNCSPVYDPAHPETPESPRPSRSLIPLTLPPTDLGARTRRVKTPFRAVFALVRRTKNPSSRFKPTAQCPEVVCQNQDCDRDPQIRQIVHKRQLGL